MEYLFERAGTRKVDLFLSNYFTKIDFTGYDIKEFRRFDHHQSHAAGAYYQSDFEKSLIFTYDGGGNGSFFNVYISESRDTGPKLIDRFDLDLGFPYMVLADHLSDIRKEPLNIGNLVYAGKLMGLCAYGTVRDEWMPHFMNFYKRFRYGGDAFKGGAEVRISATNELFSAIGVNDVDFELETTRFDGEFSWDIAATSQAAFEEVFLELAMPYINKYSPEEYPICLSGGCALNVLLNARLLKMVGKNNIFVPPNTNDCGIAVGGLLDYIKPREVVDLTYSGLPIMDEREYTALIEDNPVKAIDEITLDDLSTLLAENYIVGVVRGNSEHGPRALGNRSILCNPVGDMKDVLNKKVKDREWYRPFAPLVRYEDVSTYFDFDSESRHMTFVADVRDTEKFPAITHVDGTGRLQTVTREQNEFIYDLITQFKEKAGHGVILNTSFNVNGKPILTRLSDAFKILMDTELDCVYYDGKIIFKSNRENEFNNLLRYEPVSMDHTNFTVYVDAFTNSEDEFKALLPKLDELQMRYKKLMIVLNERHMHLFTVKSDATIIPRGQRQMFYRDMIGGAGFPNKEVDFIKPLWFKDIIENNALQSDYHIVVDLTFEKSFENFKEFMTKYMGEADVANSIITDTEDFSTITVKEFLSKRSNYVETNDRYPRFGLYAGYSELMSWFLRTYEGNLRYHMLNGRGESSRDYLAIQYLENEGKFLILEQQ
jgi:carbamoyltransferase